MNEVVDEESTKVINKALEEREARIKAATSTAQGQIVAEAVQEETSALSAEVLAELLPPTSEPDDPGIDPEAMMAAMAKPIEDIVEEINAEECRECAKETITDVAKDAVGEEMVVSTIIREAVAEECSAVAAEVITEEALGRAGAEEALAANLAKEVADEMSAETSVDALRPPDDLIANGVLDDFLVEESVGVAREVMGEAAADAAAEAAALTAANAAIGESIVDDAVAVECRSIAQDVLDEAGTASTAHDDAAGAISNDITEEVAGEMIRKVAEDALEQELFDIIVAELKAELQAEVTDAEAAAIAKETMEEAFTPPDYWEVEFTALVDVFQATGDVSKADDDELMAALGNEAEEEVVKIEAFISNSEPDQGHLEQGKGSRGSFQKSADTSTSDVAVVGQMSTDLFMKAGAWMGSRSERPPEPKLRVAAIVAVARSWGASDKVKTAKEIFADLPSWCNKQREAKRQGILDPEKERLLNELGFDWGDKKENAVMETLHREVTPRPASPLQTKPTLAELPMLRVRSPPPLPEFTRPLPRQPKAEGAGGGAHGAIHPQSVREQNIVAYRRHVREVKQAEALRVEYSNGSTALPDVAADVAEQLTEAGVAAVPVSWQAEAQHQRREYLEAQFSGVSTPAWVAPSERSGTPGWEGGHNSSPQRPPSQSLVHWSTGIKDRGEGRYNINPPPSTEIIDTHNNGDEEADYDGLTRNNLDSRRPGTAPMPTMPEGENRVGSPTELRAPRMLSAASGSSNKWWLRPMTASPKKGAAAVELAAQRRFQALARENGVAAMDHPIDAWDASRPGSPGIFPRQYMGGNSARMMPSRFAASRVTAGSTNQRASSAAASRSYVKYYASPSKTRSGYQHQRPFSASSSINADDSMMTRMEMSTERTPHPQVTAIIGDLNVHPATPQPTMPGTTVGVVITAASSTRRSGRPSSSRVASPYESRHSNSSRRTLLDSARSSMGSQQPRQQLHSAASRIARSVAAADSHGVAKGSGSAPDRSQRWAPQVPPSPQESATEPAAAGAVFRLPYRFSVPSTPSPARSTKNIVPFGRSSGSVSVHQSRSGSDRFSMYAPRLASAPPRSSLSAWQASTGKVAQNRGSSIDSARQHRASSTNVNDGRRSSLH